MKKHCLVLLAAVLLFAALFSAAAYAEGEPDRLVLTSIQTGSTVVPFNNPPYETWFIDQDNGAVYAITVASKQQYAIDGERFPYTAATVDGKLNLTLTDGRFKDQKIIIDGTTATMTVKNDTTTTIYRFNTFADSAYFNAQCEGKQNGTYLEYSFDAKNGTGTSQFRYDVFDSAGERVQTGTTTGNSFRFMPDKADTYTLYLTAMDQNLILSEYAKSSLVYDDSLELVVYNGIVTGYNGTGTSVTIPESFDGQPVTGIAANAFGYARDLEKITLPDSISIDPHAFDNCSAKLFCTVGSKTAHTLSSDLNHPFYNKATDTDGKFALEYMKMNGYDGEILALVNYTGTDADVIVPEYVDYIYNNAFRDNSTITSVMLPSNVKGIGTNVFNGCRRLNAVTVGSGLKSIGQNAFYNCVSLSKLDLTASNDITSIGSNAFYNCNADIYCDPNAESTWKTVSAVPKNFFYEDNDLIMELRNDAAKGLTLYRCFGTGAQSELTIPNNVEYIADNAFAGNKALITLKTEAGSKLKEIGNYAFSGCTNLMTVKLDNASALTTIGNYAFSGCEKLNSVTLGANVTSLGSFAFTGCKALTALTLPDKITSIGDGTFYGCTGMDELTLPDKITYIGGSAFTDGPRKIICGHTTTTARTVSAMPHTFYEKGDETMGLRWIRIGGADKLALYHYDGNNENVVVPKYVEYIADEAFKGNKTLKTVLIQAGVTGIGDNAFNGCSELTRVTVSENLTNIGANAFAACDKLNELDLTASKHITSIGANAFGDEVRAFCTIGDKDDTWKTVLAMPHSVWYKEGGLAVKLTLDEKQNMVLSKCEENGTDNSTFVIPDVVDYIADNAFKGNTNLTGVSVRATSRLKKIGASAFSGCLKLAAAEFDKATVLTEIGDSAFSECVSLTSVKLPESLKTIGASAFTGCILVDALTLPDQLETIGKDAFTGGPKKVVCDRTKDSAKLVSAMPFTFYEKTNDKLGLRWENENKDLVLYDYADTADPVDAVVPGYVDAVKKDAFSKLKSTLRSVKFEGLVAEIPTGTFDDYDKLETIELVPGIALAEKAIQNCPELSKVLGLNDLSVYETNFDNCPKLMLDLSNESLFLSKDVDYVRAAKLVFTGTVQKTEYASPAICRFDKGVVTALNPGETTITLYADGKLGQVNVEVISGLRNGLKLPTALTAIEAEAFAGSKADYVVVPAGTTAIGANAFANNTSLRFINIPNGAALDATALAGCENVIAVVSSSDSTNIGICEANGISYQFLADR